MFVNFDAIFFERNRIHLRGFAVPKDKGDYTVTLTDEDGRTVAIPERVPRPDVSAVYTPGTDSVAFGFYADTFTDTSKETTLCFTSKNDASDSEKVRIGRFLKLTEHKDSVRGRTGRIAKIAGAEAEGPYSQEEEILKAFRASHSLSEALLEQQRKSVYRHEPTINVYLAIPTEDPYRFAGFVDNLTGQTYGKVCVFAEESVLGPAAAGMLHEISGKNEAVTAVRGGIDPKMLKDGFFMRLSENGFFEKNAFFEFVRAFNTAPDAQFMYCDEDVFDEERLVHTDARLKPDFSLTFLRSHHYIGTPFMVRTSAAEELIREGGLTLPAYDYVLRLAEKCRKNVLHVSGLLYASVSGASEITDDETACRLIEASYERDGVTAKAVSLMPGYYTAEPVLSADPKVSVLIPNKDHAEDIRRSVTSLLEKASYRNIEILIIDNNSETEEIQKVYEELEKRDPRVRTLHYEGAFNFSAINNFAADQADGEYLLTLNNDTEVVTPDFIERMLFFAMLPDTGAVGAKLLYEDGTLQHVGVLVGAEGKVRHSYGRGPGEDPGYMGRNVVPSDFSAVTAACMMTKKSVFRSVRGFDESFAVAYNDIDYCLKLREKGLDVLLAPSAVLKHYESKSRGLDTDAAGRERLDRAYDRLVSRHKKSLERDPFYHDFFSFERGYFLLPEAKKAENEEKDRLFFQVDMISEKAGEIMVDGWAISTKNKVTYTLKDRNKKDVPFMLIPVLRRDASRAILKDTSQEYCGFRVQFTDPGRGPYMLYAEDRKHRKKKLITTGAASADEQRTSKKYVFGRVVKSYLREPALTRTYLKEEGLAAFRRQTAGEGRGERYRYFEWFKRHQPDDETLRKQRETVFEYAPKISLVVPAYKTPAGFLKEMLASVQNQTYANWELCIADGSYPDTGVVEILEACRKEDPRIVYKALTENKMISGNTNEALQLVTGEWIALMDHDDILTPDALYEMVKAMNEDRDTECVYTDEDKISMDLKFCFEPFFKPDYDVELLSCGNYICHFFCVKKSVVDEIGLFDSACNGAQDMDFILRCTEKAKKTAHVPKILYHWRSHPNSTAQDSKSKMYCYEAGALSANKHFARENIPATAYISAYFGHYCAFYDRPETEPLISCVIWGGDEEAAAFTENSIISVTDYQNFEFIRDLSKLPEAKGEYLLFVRAGSELLPFTQVSDNDMMISEASVGKQVFPYNMLGALRDPKAGFVGGKITDQNDTLYYCSALRHPDHAVDYLYRKHERDHVGYNGLALDRRRTSAVSLCFAMIRKEVFDKAGGLKTGRYAELSDTALCYELTRLGCHHLFDPMLTLKLPFVQQVKPLHLLYPEAVSRIKEDYADVISEKDPNTNPNMTVHMGEYVYRE